MEALKKLENTIIGWLTKVPNLPESVRKWLGDNIWWIAIVGAILIGLAVTIQLTSLMGAIAILGSVGATYYASATFTSYAITTGFISLFFSVLTAVLLIIAVKPLQSKEKKGWVILFAVWLLNILTTVVSAALTLNPVFFITTILFNAIWIAISGYLLFEMHSQFAHVEKSRGVKAATKATTK